MNDHDRENLNFLLTSSPETLLEWYNTVDEDDHAYASELMTRYSEELSLRSVLHEDDVKQDGQAAEYLKKFSIKK